MLLLCLTGCATGVTKTWSHTSYNPDMATADEKAAWKAAYNRDNADCMKEGYAYQTYSSGWGVSPQYGGGGGGSSHFNSDVYQTCMQARGYVIAKKGLKVLGVDLF
jgi:hypothetical protein